MDNVFWLEPGRLAGRPGPDVEPWDVATLRAGGIRAIVSVNDGRGVIAQDMHALALPYSCYPMPDRVPPALEDEHVCAVAVERAYAFITAHQTDGRPVLVHCSSGKDRTGLVMAHYLVRRHGLSPEEAIGAVRRVRPIALNARGWEEMAIVMLSRTI